MNVNLTSLDMLCPKCGCNTKHYFKRRKSPSTGFPNCKDTQTCGWWGTWVYNNDDKLVRTEDSDDRGVTIRRPKKRGTEAASTGSNEWKKIVQLIEDDYRRWQVFLRVLDEFVAQSSL
jgi:hypothetical protein